VAKRRESKASVTAERLESLIDQWLSWSVEALWNGDLQTGASYFTAAFFLVREISKLGVAGEAWDFPRFFGWVREAHRQTLEAHRGNE